MNLWFLCSVISGRFRGECVRMRENKLDHQYYPARKPRSLLLRAIFYRFVVCNGRNSEIGRKGRECVWRGGLCGGGDRDKKRKGVTDTKTRYHYEPQRVLL